MFVTILWQYRQLAVLIRTHFGWSILRVFFGIKCFVVVVVVVVVDVDFQPSLMGWLPIFF